VYKVSYPITFFFPKKRDGCELDLGLGFREGTAKSLTIPGFTEPKKPGLHRVKILFVAI